VEFSCGNRPAHGCLRWGGRRVSCPLCPLSCGARITLHTELFPYFISFELAFSGVVEFGSRKFFSGQVSRPPT